MALDATVDGNPVDPSWGDIDDVSDLISKTHLAFKSKEPHHTACKLKSSNFAIENGFQIKERGDVSVSHARRILGAALTLG